LISSDLAPVGMAIRRVVNDGWERERNLDRLCAGVPRSDVQNVSEDGENDNVGKVTGGGKGGDVSKR